MGENCPVSFVEKHVYPEEIFAAGGVSFHKNMNIYFARSSGVTLLNYCIVPRTLGIGGELVFTIEPLMRTFDPEIDPVFPSPEAAAAAFVLMDLHRE